MNRLNGSLSQGGVSSPLFSGKSAGGQTRLLYGFIGSATASMIADHPKLSEVEKDVVSIRVPDFENNKSLSIPQYILKLKLAEARSSILELIRISGLQAQNMKQDIAEVKVNHLYKCGALLKEGKLQQIRKMAMSDTHIQQFDRDFLGFILNISFDGKIIFNSGTASPFYLKFSFSGIPFLSFKSENAYKDDKSRNICREMLAFFSSRDTIPVFL